MRRFQASDRNMQEQCTLAIVYFLLYLLEKSRAELVQSRLPASVSRQNYVDLSQEETSHIPLKDLIGISLVTN